MSGTVVDIRARASRVLSGTQTGRYTKRAMARDLIHLADALLHQDKLDRFDPDVLDALDLPCELHATQDSYWKAKREFESLRDSYRACVEHALALREASSVESQPGARLSEETGADAKGTKPK